MSKFVGKTFHVLSQITGSERMYKVELLPQHDGSFEEFAFRVERSVTRKDDVMFFVYKAARGLAPISASYDKNRVPLDYFVVGTNSSTKRFYVESGNAKKFAEITMDDPRLRDCGWSSGNATEIQAYDLTLKGKWYRAGTDIRSS